MSFILDFLPPSRLLHHRYIYYLSINSCYNDINVPQWAWKDGAYRSLSIHVNRHYQSVILYLYERV